MGVPPNSLLAPDRSCILHRAVAASQQGGDESRQLLHASTALRDALVAVEAHLGRRQKSPDGTALETQAAVAAWMKLEAASQHGKIDSRELLHCQHGSDNALVAVVAPAGAAPSTAQPGHRQLWQLRTRCRAPPWAD